MNTKANNRIKIQFVTKKNSLCKTFYHRENDKTLHKPKTKKKQVQ